MTQALVLVNSDTVEKSAEMENFADLNFSLGWMNILERWGIDFESAEQEQFSLNVESASSPTSLIVVSSSVRNMDVKRVGQIEHFICSGGFALFDMPGPEFSGITGISVCRPGEFTLKDPGFCPAENHSAPFALIGDMPVFTRFCKTESIPDEALPLLYLDGKPAVFLKKAGRGWIMVFLFDFPMQITATIQGVPHLPGFSVRKRLGLMPLLRESGDLPLHRKMLNSAYPVADILEKYLISAIEDRIFLPRLWYYPHDFDGAFLMSHDDEKRGEKGALFLAEEEEKRGFVSTFFVIAGDGLEKRWGNSVDGLLNRGFDFQWHWNRFPDNFRVCPPEKQVDNLRRLIGNRLNSSRIHFLNWGGDYTAPFETIEENGIGFDSTYGPNWFRGYLFGTGMPFHPMGRRGKLMNIYEIPFQTQEDWGGANWEYFETLMGDSGKIYHGVIVPIFHPHKIARGTGRSLWLGTFDLARKNRHWITTFGCFGEFHRQRAKSRLEIRGDGETGFRVSMETGAVDASIFVRDEYVPYVSGNTADGIRLVEDSGFKYRIIRKDVAEKALFRRRPS